MFPRKVFPVRWIALPVLVALVVTGCGSNNKKAAAPTSTPAVTAVPPNVAPTDSPVPPTATSAPTATETPAPQSADASLSVDADQVELRSGADGAWTAVTDTQIVTSADAVRTDATGQAVLTFFTGTQAEITPNSELEVSSFETAADGSTTITLKQISGQTLHRVAQMADSNSRYEVDTPVAMITVRGTEFGIAVAEDGATQVKVTTGTVRVDAGGQQIDVTPGQALKVDANAVPGTPYPIDQGVPMTPQATPSIAAILPPSSK